jgi:hypothetical protein
VTFRAWRGDTFVPLIEVLVAIGSPVLGRQWVLRHTEFAPGWRGSEELHRAGREGASLPTLTLLDLVSDGIQLVDGELIGDDPSGERPPLIVRSARGDDWDVQIDDTTVLTAIRSHFADVRDLPDD